MNSNYEILEIKNGTPVQELLDKLTKLLAEHPEATVSIPDPDYEHGLLTVSWSAT